MGTTQALCDRGIVNKNLSVFRSTRASLTSGTARFCLRRDLAAENRAIHLFVGCGDTLI